jgi:hypothetical protein
VHERLDELLAGDGSLAERYQAWVDGETVPTGRVVPALRDVVVELRDRTSELVELPDGEAVVVDEVRDEPWLAFNYYLGGLKSRVVVNVDSPSTCDDIVELAAHEVYPGHHTEHATKEQLFVREHGQLEETIKLVPTPEALVSEGLAETGPSIVLREGAIQRLEALLRRHGLDTDLGRARTIREVRRPLRRLGLDAALMIHEDGSGADEAMEHAERWGLVPPERAAQMVRFVTDPTWRAYVVNYSAGRELCADWVGGDGARFARLLTEQVRVRDLLAELSSAT